VRLTTHDSRLRFGRLNRMTLGGHRSRAMLNSPTDPECSVSVCLSAELVSNEVSFQEFSPMGKITEKSAPQGLFDVAESRPPWFWTIERQIDNPIPNPLALVV
jgi:hypothetical protein